VRRHLEHVLRVFVDYYTSHRPHQALNFTGVGEGSAPVREDICSRLRFLGVDSTQKRTDPRSPQTSERAAQEVLVRRVPQ
jgi:acetate kinase